MLENHVFGRFDIDKDQVVEGRNSPIGDTGSLFIGRNIAFLTTEEKENTMRVGIYGFVTFKECDGISDSKP